jgi:hypothetical protein
VADQVLLQSALHIVLTEEPNHLRVETLSLFVVSLEREMVVYQPSEAAVVAPGELGFHRLDLEHCSSELVSLEEESELEGCWFVWLERTPVRDFQRGVLS